MLLIKMRNDKMAMLAFLVALALLFIPEAHAVDLEITAFTSDPASPTDSPGVQDVTLKCEVSLPSADITSVVFTGPNSFSSTATTPTSGSIYETILSDVHPANTGTYTCTATASAGNVTTDIENLQLTVDCANDFYGSMCNQRCNCVTGGTCNQGTGVCSCTEAFAGASCDKDLLTVTLTAVPANTIIDVADTAQSVTLTCTINLPDADVQQVQIVKVSGTNPPAASGSNGVYTTDLSDVHPSDSGAYRCDVTTMINGASSTTMSDEYTLDVDCVSDFSGPNCDMRCNCVDSGNCNQETGVCSCTPAFADAVCDKDALTVTLTSNVPNPVIDTSTDKESVFLTCNVNLPDADVTVQIVKLPSNQPISLETSTNGVYTVLLSDVHPATSGNYSCEATRDIDGTPATKMDDYLLTVNCVSDFSGPNCDMRCNCVDSGNCNQGTEVCSCTPAFTGAVCDKDSLSVVSVTSDPASPVPDTSSQDGVTVKCRTNLPASDVRVALIYPNTTSPITMSHRMDGLYELTLPDVHESSSGDYTCTVSAKPLDLGISDSRILSLSVVDVDECTSSQYPHNCNDNAMCNNTKGRFQCPCNAGYEGTGFGSTGCTICTPGVKYGLNCEENCTCVLPIQSGQNDVECNNVDGMCTCDQTEFSGKTCDKRNLQVTLLPDPSPVLDTSGTDTVTWKCSVNLHSRDLILPVTITYPGGGTFNMAMNGQGLYEYPMYDVTPNNNGGYICTATAQGMAPETGPFDLDVLIIGNIISVSDSVEGRVGDAVQINCKVYARQGVSITWHFGDNEIMDSNKYTITNSSLDDFEQISYLTVTKLTPDDNGTYVCSSRGDTRDALIIIIERPVISSISLSALSFNQLSVSWIIDFDGNLPPPNCTVDYGMTQTALTPSPGSPVVDVTHVVMGLQPYTEYYIRVQCTNKVGSSNEIEGGPERTLATNPTEPLNLASTMVKPESFVVTWNEPAMKNGPINFYRVSVSTPPDGQDHMVGPLMERTARVTQLTAYTNYTVEVIAVNIEGAQELPSPSARETFRTAQDAPSRPLNVESQQPENACLVSWDRPENENGIIQSFTVYYTAYPRPGTGLSAEADMPNSGAMFVNGNQDFYSFNKSDLASFSDFRFQVSATTVEEGARSTEAVGSCTTNAAVPDKPGKPVEPNDKGNPITESSFVMRLAPVNQRNGPISCFEVTVVPLNNDDVIRDVDPDILYHPDMLGNYQEAHDTAGTPYVAVVLAGHELSSARDVTIGSGGTTECGSTASARKRRQTPRRHEGENGALSPSTKYTAFIRAFVTLEDGMEEYVTSDLLQPVYTGNAQTVPTAIIAVVCVLVAVIVITLVACGVIVCQKKRKARRSRPKGTTAVEMDTIDYEVTLPEASGIASTVYEDVGLPSWALRWEILWKNLVIDDKVLGRGNFGEVRSGTVNIGGKRTKTAIKVLKGHASKTDREDFMEEFRTMTNIGYHPNVVTLLGACQKEDVLCVALEYLPNGDLRSYLRKGRSDSESDEGALSSGQLIKFALDVAKGMKHLAMSGVIHRDLAARNILLSRQFVAKVSDFGLSRGEDIYVQASTRRVPMRWLAIESLLDRTYTTQSDVWSFGILLWEIASIGGTPYPTIATRSLAAQLTEGYRMTKPANCDEEIYSLMLRCWEEEPSNRPSFSDLSRILSKMYEKKTDQTYMAIDREHYENWCVIRPELDDN